MHKSLFEYNVQHRGAITMAGSQRMPSIATIMEIIDPYKQELRGMAMEDPRYTPSLLQLISLLLYMSEATEIVDLTEAIGWSERAVNNPDFPRYVAFSSLATFLFKRFQKRSDSNLDDLTQAITAFDTAVNYGLQNGTPVPLVAGTLHLLGTSLRMRFELAGSMEDLDRAIVASRNAVDQLGSDDPEFEPAMYSLVQSLTHRYDRKGAASDLDFAILGSAKILNLISVRHPNHFSWVICFAKMLSHRFEREGKISDVDIAIQILRETMNQPVRAGESHAERDAAVFQRLGYALLLRSERTGSMQNMEEGMTLLQVSLTLFPADSVESALCRSLLGRGSHSKFEQTGDLNLLNEIIESLDGAVKRLPLDHQGRAGAASNLGVLLYRRFERLASLDDLDAAIVASKAAINSTSPNDLTYPDLLNNYACFLSSRYARTGDRQDIELAIRTSESIMEFAGVTHQHSGKYLNSLARHFHTRYQRKNTIDDLDRAISALEKALECIPPHHPDRVLTLYDLGVVFGHRYVHSQTMEDLDRGIENIQASLRCASSSGPSRASAFSSLGDMLRLRMEHPTDKQLTHDLSPVISAYQSALDIESARPLVRIQSARRSAELTKDVQLAYTSLIRAVHLMPYLCPRSLHRDDQQYILTTISGLASQAVAYILKLEHKHVHAAFEALKTLEIARGVMASLLIDTRTDLDDLFISNAHLAHEFQRLRDILDSPKLPLSTDLRSELDSSRRQKAAADFADVLRQIRKISGFESFLSGPSEEQLKTLIVHGPLVIFNVASIRSDALLVTNDGVRSLHLPSLNAVELEAHAKSVLASLDRLTPRTYATANKILRHVLEWLWDVAVSPVLDALGFTETPKEGEDWPHVWWVACGWLNLLPIHAAGYHDGESSRNALDRVISSYTSTVKALTYSRTCVTSQSPTALLICMTETPDHTPLRYARAEIDELDRILPPSIARTVLESPSKACVLSAVRKCDILHFACHGKFDPDNPSQSHLLLQDWANDLLSTADITSLKLDRPRLVYLSACHGASNRTEALFDEGIHIAGAFQLAGFQHVIGTLWQIGQHFSLNVSRDVYSAITADARFDVEKAAEGLHGALRSLRSLVVQEYGVSRRMCNEPLVWAPYIHMGA